MMRLAKVVDPYKIKACCSKCNQVFKLEEMYADLNGKIGDFYCIKCAKEIGGADVH
jgi:hypothetical protein